jgi:hypothetical protein
MKALLIILLLPICSFGQLKTLSYADPFSSPDTIKKRTDLLNRIFLSDSICITLNSSGCFHSHTSRYYIVKKEGNYILNYVDINGDKRKPKLMKSKTYTSLKELCIKGLSLGLGLCTTRDTITISDKTHSTYFMDDRCSSTDDYLDKIDSLLR